MERDAKATQDRDPQNCPTAWFAVLERAREEGDYERAAQAERELRRLGVAVRFNGRKARGGAR